MQRIWTPGIALVTAILLCAPALAQRATPSEQQPSQPTGTSGVTTVTVEKIADNPSEWYGKKVTIKAQVGDIFSRKVFNVEEEGIIDVDDEVLIVAPKHSKYLNPDQVVTVTGTVQAFVRTEIERTWDGLDWDLAPELLIQFEKRPVIVADSVTAGSIPGK